MVSSARNDGPGSETLSNGSPWMYYPLISAEGAAAANASAPTGSNYQMAPAIS